MNQPDHTPANRIIAATFHDDSVGFKGNVTIKRVDVEFPKGSSVEFIRVISVDTNDAIVDVCESPSVADLIEHLSKEFAISRNYFIKRLNFRRTFDARQAAAENFSLEEDVKSGLLMQFIAGGVVYSIVRQGAYIIVRPNEEDRKFEALYTVYAQTEGDEDPDTAKILEESYDTQFEAVTCIRNLIEKDLFQAFMPEACK